MRRESRETAPDALDVLEEAAHLLRRAPLTVHAAQLAGAIPFLLGLLYFVADMSRSADARQHVAAGALGLAVLFGWMKTWQAVAAGRLLADLEQRPAAPLRAALLLRLGLRQFRLHAAGLLLLPVAFVVAVPFGWVYAYYQGLTVLGRGTAGELHRASLVQARLWPAQNHTLLAVVALASLFVFVNVGTAVYFAPALLRSFLGLAGVLTTTGWNPLNTTFLAVTVALTWLVLDPWLKAAYVLRCFYGKARRDGVDLLVQVRAAEARPASVLPAVLLLFVVLGGTAGPGQAAESEAAPAPGVETSPAAAAPVVEGARLDAALDRVLREPEYSWRRPRAAATAEDDSSLFGRFVRAVHDGYVTVQRWMVQLTERFVRWLMGRDAPGRGLADGGGPSPVLLRVLLIALGGVLLVVLAWFGWRWWKAGRAPPPAIVPATTVTPVLEADDVTADQLPEDEWLRLAGGLLQRGEVRLALRAFFLATLAGLAGREVLVLARHKSNRDYEAELARRGGGAGPLARVFADNRRLLEHVWYGRHVPAEDEVVRFQANVRHLLGGGA